MTTKTKKTQSDAVNRRQELAKIALAVKADVDVDDSTRISVQDLIDWGCVNPLYLDAAKDAAKNGTRAPLKIKITAQLLVALCRANGRNRSRQWSHVATLAAAMQSDFRPELTHFAITTDGLIGNGGHSAPALLAALCPLDLFIGFGLHYQSKPTKDKDGKFVIGKDGEPVTENIPTIPIREVNEGDEGLAVVLRDTGLDDDGDGRFAYERWDEETLLADAEQYIDVYYSTYPEDRWVQITVNCDPDVVRKFDTVARGRMGAEQLELFHPSRQFVTDEKNLWNFKLLEQVLKTLYLRAKTTPTKDENNVVRYGTPKGGGNTDKGLFPVFFLAHIERLQDNVDAAANKSGFHIDSEIKMIPIKDALVAICAVSKTAAAKLGKELRAGTNPDLLALNQRLTAPTNKAQRAAWRRPDASYIQSVLIAVANGQKLDTSKTSTDPVHQLVARGKGWDRGEMQGGETYHTEGALRDAGESVDEYFGDDAKRADKFREKRAYRKRSKGGK